MSIFITKFIVKGRVQGVGYRRATEKKATELGLSGFVRNLPSGNVEVMAKGEEEAVNKLLFWCKSGPPAAFVTEIEAGSVDDRDYDYENFTILR